MDDEEQHDFEQGVACIKAMIDQQRCFIADTVASAQPLAAMRKNLELDFLESFLKTRFAKRYWARLQARLRSTSTVWQLPVQLCDRGMEGGCSWDEIEPGSFYCRGCPAAGV